MANPLSATQQPYFRGLELIADSKQHENVALLERRLGRRGTHPGIDAPQHRDARTFHVPPESKIQSPFYFVPCSSRISAAAKLPGSPSTTTTSPASKRVSGAGSPARMPRRRTRVTLAPSAGRSISARVRPTA